MRLRRTLFRSDVKEDSIYDYALINYYDVIKITHKLEDTGVITTIHDMSNTLNSDYRTALAAMGYLYQMGILKKINATEYMYDFTDIDI